MKKADPIETGSLFAASRDPKVFGRQVLFFRSLALLTIASGLYYIVWRYMRSLNVQALWFSIPVLIAETYGIVDMLLFVLMMWKPTMRTSPPAPASAVVDVFITTYNEPVELLRLTVDAAMRIRWEGKRVHILDDGARESMRALAASYGCGYITRGEAWTGKPKHAKAGNVNNALLLTSGEFVLILDADQIPAPEILEKTMGFFADERLAFVQTPQYFYNIMPGDPFGSDAPLFYGPILQGKDGWNSAFFCGSNAVLRREALMQLGLTNYVAQMESQMKESLAAFGRRARSFRTNDIVERAAMRRFKQRIELARAALERGETLATVSKAMQSAVAEVESDIAKHDLGKTAEALRSLAETGDLAASEAYEHIMGNMRELSTKTARDGNVPVSPEAVRGLDLSRPEEAIPVQALATISITEDMATAMRLHAFGWRSVFYPEVLAYGLAPEDLESALKQRLRWAQGTIQVLVRENPLKARGLSLAQRLMYFATMYSYFSGFFNLVLMLSPVVFLFTNIAPINSWSSAFFIHLVPFLILNKVLFRYVAAGRSAWHGERYSVALFPLWIKAVLSVLWGKKLAFAVTPKVRKSGRFLHLVRPQLALVLLTFAAIGYGAFSVIAGLGMSVGGYVINTLWSLYNVAMLMVIIRAAVYAPPQGWEAKPPSFLFPEDLNTSLGKAENADTN